MYNQIFVPRWLRVVLDEGHTIKNHLSKCHKAAAELDTQRKWLVSGTPIQNNLKELWSLLKFLEYEPYTSFRKLFREQVQLRMYSRVQNVTTSYFVQHT